MYAQDYDECLPACVPGILSGTAHCVSPADTGKTMDVFRSSEKSWGNGGPGLWVWQLPDLILPYVKSVDIFNCPTLIRRDEWWSILMVTLSGTGYPIEDLIPGVRKTDQQGSYLYFCVHHPEGANSPDYYIGDMAGDNSYGYETFDMWDAGVVLAMIADPGGSDGSDIMACSQALGLFDNPVWEPILMCWSWGVHEGYSTAYLGGEDDAGHVVPVELGGAAPTVPAATPIAFSDGHAKYWRNGFYETIALTTATNQIQ
jgi:hypothetical protein